MLIGRAGAHAASGPSVVVAATKGIIGLEFDPDDSYCRVTVDADGSLYEYNGTSSSTGSRGSTYEVWLDAGLNSQVWVERTVVSGSLFNDAGTGRLACTTDRVFDSRSISIGQDTTVIDLDFYDAASGGNLLDTQRVTLTSEVQNIA